MKQLPLPLVSIITVVYNGEKYLQQTIDSVKNQTYNNIEYIIIDGGSTDKTIAIIKKNLDVITNWVSEPDNGLYDAMNKGIKMAKGELIGIINSDDWYELNALKMMVDAYMSNPTKTIFHADRFDVDEEGNKTVRKFNPSVLKFKYYGMTYNHPSMFIAKKEYEKHLYNDKLRAQSDYQFILEALLRNKKVFYYINHSIVNYRLDGISGNITLNKALKEGYITRKNAGLNIFQNILSVLLRFLSVKVKKVI